MSIVFSQNQKNTCLSAVSALELSMTSSFHQEVKEQRLTAVGVDASGLVSIIILASG